MWKVQWLKGEKPEDLEDELVIWTEQVIVMKLPRNKLKYLDSRWVWQILYTKIGMCLVQKMRFIRDEYYISWYCKY
jgi:hypothetical protein